MTCHMQHLSHVLRRSLSRAFCIAHTPLCAPADFMAQTLVGAVVEAPLALDIVAVRDVPRLAAADVALQRVNGRATDNLARSQIVSPMSLCHSNDLQVCRFSGRTRQSSLCTYIIPQSTKKVNPFFAKSLIIF